MGNIEVNPKGSGKATVVLPGVSLTGTGGTPSVEGRAIILHEKADDFGQPTGNAGGRIGCGIITVTGK
jgi:Cu-Zn family superoxide dismutase